MDTPARIDADEDEAVYDGDELVVRRPSPAFEGDARGNDELETIVDPRRPAERMREPKRFGPVRQLYGRPVQIDESRPRAEHGRVKEPISRDRGSRSQPKPRVPVRRVDEDELDVVIKPKAPAVIRVETRKVELPPRRKGPEEDRERGPQRSGLIVATEASAAAEGLVAAIAPRRQSRNAKDQRFVRCTRRQTSNAKKNHKANLILAKSRDSDDSHAARSCGPQMSPRCKRERFVNSIPRRLTFRMKELAVGKASVKILKSTIALLSMRPGTRPSNRSSSATLRSLRIVVFARANALRRGAVHTMNPLGNPQMATQERMRRMMLPAARTMNGLYFNVQRQDAKNRQRGFHRAHGVGHWRR